MDDANCPYREGALLVLNDTKGRVYAEALITQVFSITWSPVMKVIIHKGTHREQTAVLKLYDRRYSPDLRKIHGQPPWTPVREEQYFKFVTSGSADVFISQLRYEENDLTDFSGEDVAESETWVHARCLRLHENEVKIYQALEDLQGICVPRLDQKVVVKPPDFPSAIAKHFEVPGILIEFIDGITLEGWAVRVPQSQWQSLCDGAVQVIHKISEHEILNEDVKPRNMIIRKRSGEPSNSSRRSEDQSDISNEQSLKVFAIDFGNCRFRRAGETDNQWREAKFWQEEEGIIGGDICYAAKRNYGVKIQWKPSREYDGPWVLQMYTGSRTYEESLLEDLEEDCFDLDNRTRQLLEDAQGWPAELEYRIFIQPSRFVMRGKRDEQSSLPQTVASNALPKRFLVGWLAIHLAIFASIWKHANKQSGA